MRLTLLTAGLYVAEYKFHRKREGRGAYDALVNTVRGEMGWPDLKSYLMTVAQDIESRQAGPETIRGRYETRPRTAADARGHWSRLPVQRAAVLAAGPAQGARMLGRLSSLGPDSRGLTRLDLVSLASEVAVLTALLDQNLNSGCSHPEAEEIKHSCWQHRIAAMGLLSRETSFDELSTTACESRSTCFAPDWRMSSTYKNPGRVALTCPLPPHQSMAPCCAEDVSNAATDLPRDRGDRRV